MRVIHFTRDFPPHSNGGLSTAVGGMVEALGEVGVACSVISFDGYRPRSGAGTDAPPARDDARGIPILRVVSPRQLDAAMTFSAGQRPDVVHVHHSMLWDLGAKLRQQTGAAAVTTVHVLQSAQNGLRGVTRATLSSAAQSRELAEADLVLAPSRATAARIERTEPGIGARLRVAPLGAHDSADARAATRTRWQLPPGPILFAGRFADLNGIDELLTSVPMILARAPNATFVIAGGLPENRRAEARRRRRFEESIPASVRARVEFTGWLETELLAIRYREAGLLVAPSWFETFGQVVLEGMLHGLPIAASACDGLTELLAHGESGLLSPPRRPEALTDDVVRLLHDRDLARRLGTRAAHDARGHHLWSTVIDRLTRAYAEVT